LDPYVAEKVVAGKQAELRAEAIQVALRAELSRASDVTEQSLWVKAMRAAANTCAPLRKLATKLTRWGRGPALAPLRSDPAKTLGQIPGVH
jgi:hypothetical protein